MRRSGWLLASTFLLALSASAQQQIRIAERSSSPPASARTAKLSKEQQQRVALLLQQAETGTASLDAASRIVAYAELARSYQARDKAKAIDLLENALAACRDLQFDSADRNTNDQIKFQLQDRVLQDFAAIAPDRLDARVFDLPPDMRKLAADLLVSYYTKNKQFDRAYDLVMRVAQEGEMPYGTATKLMKAMKERPDEVRSLFVSSLASYDNHSDQPSFKSRGDFSDMIIAFHSQLPDQVVLDGIDAVLGKAKKQDDTGPKLNVSMASSKGAVQFHSMYEFRLFQLLPILKQIDAGRAAALLRDEQAVATQLNRYPQGTNSLHNGDDKDKGLSMMMSFGDGPGPRGGSEPSVLERERVAQIMADAQKHPQDALANAALLSPSAAIGVYEEIARANVKSDTAVTRTALAKALDVVDKIPLDRQMMSIQGIAAVYVQLDDNESAKKTLEKGMKVAGELYKKDIDPDDPNTAPKAYWLSTNGWRSILASAQKLNGAWAQALLNQIPDDSIRVFNQIAMADSILGTPPTGYVVMSAPKNGDGGYTMFVGNGN